MNFRTKISKVNIKTLAALVLRIIDTVINSGIEAAKVSKRFLHLVDVNTRYQKAITLDEEANMKEAVKAKYNLRSELFLQMYAYLEGLLNSPDAEIKAASNLLFRQVNRFGKNFGKLRLADQTTQYVTIIEALKRPEFTAALLKTLLTQKLIEIDNAHKNYEQLYMDYGNSSNLKVAPSNLRKELSDAVKLYMDEVNLMASENDTAQWYTLCTNLQIRFDEVSVTVARKSKLDVKTESKPETKTETLVEDSDSPKVA
jgi:hypothetical protein